MLKIKWPSRTGLGWPKVQHISTVHISGVKIIVFPSSLKLFSKQVFQRTFVIVSPTCSLSLRECFLKSNNVYKTLGAVNYCKLRNQDGVSCSIFFTLITTLSHFLRPASLLSLPFQFYFLSYLTEYHLTCEILYSYARKHRKEKTD